MTHPINTIPFFDFLLLTAMLNSRHQDHPLFLPAEPFRCPSE